MDCAVKPSTVRSRFLPHQSPCLCHVLFNRPVVGKTALLRQKLQQTHYYYRIATKLAKACQYLFLWFQSSIDEEKKTLLQANVDLTINFDLMINFDFFLPNNLGFTHGMIVKFGLWTFHELSKRQKNFDVIDFWLP